MLHFRYYSKSSHQISYWGRWKAKLPKSFRKSASLDLRPSATWDSFRSTISNELGTQRWGALGISIGQSSLVFKRKVFFSDNLFLRDADAHDSKKWHRTCRQQDIWTSERHILNGGNWGQWLLRSAECLRPCRIVESHGLRRHSWKEVFPALHSACIQP